MKFHHIGLACENIIQEIENISKMHDVIHVSAILFDTLQNAELCMLKTAEGVSIELISGGHVANLVKKKKTFYHLAFETDDIDAEITRLQALGGLLIAEPKPAILFGFSKVAFLQVSYGLVELVQLNQS